MNKENVLLFTVILLFVVGIILVSGCVGETKEGTRVDESGTENTREPPTWSFNGTLYSDNDSDTYELDLRDKSFGCLLVFELAGPNPQFIYPILLDSNKTPIFQLLELRGNTGVVVDGGEIYYVVVKTRGANDSMTYYDILDKEYVIDIRLFPHSNSNSSDTAVPIQVPIKFESNLISTFLDKGKFRLGDINWFKIGPINSNGLLIIDSDTPLSHSFDNYGSYRSCSGCRISLLNDKLEVVGGKKIGLILHYPVEEGAVYYMKIEHESKRTLFYPYIYSFSIDIDLVSDSLNDNPGDAIPLHLSETIEGEVVSIKDANWFKLDLGNYSDGDILINISFPEETMILNPIRMELLDENKTNLIGYVYANPSYHGPLWQSTFKRGMPQTVGSYPKKEIEGGRVYHLKVYLEDRVNHHVDPPAAYKLEVKATTMVPFWVMEEEANTYALVSNTANTAVAVDLPAYMDGRVSSEGDVQWFKTDLSVYPGGGVLIVTFTMPNGTEPRCGFVCRQPVCFNVPRTPTGCSHYQFEVFKRDKKTKVTTGSTAPKKETTFKDVLESGDQYYFKISAPHGRYNKEESYTIDVRFYPG